MNRSLRLADCSWGVSWLNVDILRNVRGIFRGQTWYCWQTTTPKIIDITTVMLCAKNNTEHKKNTLW